MPTTEIANDPLATKLRLIVYSVKQACLAVRGRDSPILRPDVFLHYATIAGVKAEANLRREIESCRDVWESHWPRHHPWPPLGGWAERF